MKKAVPVGIVVFFMLVNCGLGQWYWPPSEVAIAPGEPTTSNVVSITLSGDWPGPGSCMPNVSTISVSGNEIYFDAIYDHPPESTVCPAVITPWEATETLGPLAAGAYTVYARLVGDAFVEETYTEIGKFNVSAVDGPTLAITEIMSDSVHSGKTDSDWWELTNTSSSAIDLTGYSWDDLYSQGNPAPPVPGTSVFGNITIAAGESIVILCDNAEVAHEWLEEWNLSNSSVNVYNMEEHFSPSLAPAEIGKPDGIALFDASGELITSVEYQRDMKGSSVVFDTNGTALGYSLIGVCGGYESTNPSPDVGSPGIEPCGYISIPGEPNMRVPLGDLDVRASWISGDSGPLEWSIEPVNPTTFDAITFFGPTRIYGNLCSAELQISGSPIFTIDSDNKKIELWFQPPFSGVACTMEYDPVSGLKGSFGSLEAGDWVFSGTIPYLRDESDTFRVPFQVVSGEISVPSLPVEPRELRVPGDYVTIQEAIDAALNGDEIVVADGTYMGQGNHDIDFGGKAITVRSANGPANCVIDGGIPAQTYASSVTVPETFGNSNTIAESSDDLRVIARSIVRGQGFYFHNDEDANSVLDGFTIQNCKTGIECRSSSPTIKNCIIRDNGKYYYGDGGGVSLIYSEAQIINCVISGNAVGKYNDGGGIYCRESDVAISNCTIVGNMAGDYGGGLACGNSSVVMNNSILWNNRAKYGREASLKIVFYDLIKIPSDDSCNLLVANSCVQGGQGAIYVSSGYMEESELDWSPGNMAVYPGFVEPGYWEKKTWVEGDYHLLGGSPCIDAGDNTAIEGYDTDVDGDERIVNETVDIGAYEYQYGTVLPSESMEISISKVKVKRGKAGASDSFTVAGTWPIDYCASTAPLDYCLDTSSLADHFENSNDVYVRFGPYAESIDIEKFKQIGNSSRYNYKGVRGGITRLTLDLDRTKFIVSAKNVDLTSLGEPILVEISFGDFYGAGEAGEDVINGNRLVPTQFMMSYEDTLVVTSIKKQRSRWRGGDVRLVVEGRISVKDTSVDLRGEDFEVQLGDQRSGALGEFERKGRGGRFVYDLDLNNINWFAPPQSGIYLNKGTVIDFDKCRFKIDLEINLGDEPLPVEGLFGIKFGNFDESVAVELE